MKRDTLDVMTSSLAVLADAFSVFAGFMLATWIRFDSGMIPMYTAHPPMINYFYGSLIATLLSLFVFRSLGLYTRPQFGHFVEKIPRIIRAIGLSILLAVILSYIVRPEPPFSRAVLLLSFISISLLVIIQRNIFFQCERHWAKYQTSKKNVVVLGAGAVAASLKQNIENEPRFRSQCTAFLTTDSIEPDPTIHPSLIKGSLDRLQEILERDAIDEVYLSNPSALSHDQMVQIILLCEKHLASFHMVPDLFSVLTSHVDVQAVGGIPLIGIGKWPLDYFWNRMVKRIEDICGSLLGLTLSLPLLLVAAIVIRKSSPGPVFYRQTRCGERGRTFTLYKLRTMRVEAEAESGPVWAEENDPRRTPVGSFLRKNNLDELPQFWNVLKGDMSLVGPRPERPHFVEQFKEDIGRYMWRHVSKPGLTGWAQINGLRGNTSITERIKYDLYYLENWSLSFDFKILVKTFFSRHNAY